MQLLAAQLVEFATFDRVRLEVLGHVSQNIEAETDSGPSVRVFVWE
jgi:hypothetical protein